MKFEQLQRDMVLAMKAHEKPRKEAISALIQAAKKVAIDEGHRDEMTDEFVNRIILKEIKAVQEQVDSCPDERAELKAEYMERLHIMQEYAPKMMGEEEIRKILQEKFAEVLAEKNKGKIMKTVMPEFKGKADGKLINKIIEEIVKGNE